MPHLIRGREVVDVVASSSSRSRLIQLKLEKTKRCCLGFFNLKLKSRCDIEGCRHKDDDVDVDANNVLLDVCKTFLVNDENLN